MLDLFNREIVGWSIKPRMTADIVTDALTPAILRQRGPAARHHRFEHAALRPAVETPALAQARRRTTRSLSVHHPAAGMSSSGFTTLPVSVA